MSVPLRPGVRQKVVETARRLRSAGPLAEERAGMLAGMSHVLSAPLQHRPTERSCIPRRIIYDVNHIAGCATLCVRGVDRRGRGCRTS